MRFLNNHCSLIFLVRFHCPFDIVLKSCTVNHLVPTSFRSILVKLSQRLKQGRGESIDFRVLTRVRTFFFSGCGRMKGFQKDVPMARWIQC